MILANQLSLQLGLLVLKLTRFKTGSNLSKNVQAVLQAPMGWVFFFKEYIIYQT